MVNNKLQVYKLINLGCSIFKLEQCGVANVLKEIRGGGSEGNGKNQGKIQ